MRCLIGSGSLASSLGVAQKHQLQTLEFYYHLMEQPKIHPQYDRKFVTKSFDMIQRFLETTLKGENQVINFKLPQELASTINFTISPEPCPQDELLRTCQAVLDHQVKPYHPHFHNQLFGGFDQYSFVGALMTPAINGSVFTYEISPCYTLMENYLFDHMRKLVGWEKIDGTMTPGGSFANFMGLLMARFRVHPEVNSKGLYGLRPMKVVTSDVSHYSIKKGMILIGAGTDNLIYVKTDPNGRMIPSQLESIIQRELDAGNEIIMVNSTVGTTVEGNIDPVTQIGEICKRYKIWHHMDAAFGGAYMMSEELIKRIGSFENVDSITFDPHKALVVPMQATFFLCKHPGLMASSNSLKADYLFHKERASYDSQLDVGDKHIQCGRVIDILKLWTYLKGNGWINIAHQVQEEHRLALYIREYVVTHPRFELAVQQVESFNICFWIIPTGLERSNFANQAQFYGLLSKVTVLAKKFMIEEGKMLVGYSKSKLPHYFWRVVMSNPYLTTQQIDEEMLMLIKYCQSAYDELTTPLDHD